MEFESVSKIWSDAALTVKHSVGESSLRKNGRREINNSATTVNRGDNCNSFSQALFGQLGSYSTTDIHKTTVSLQSEIQGQNVLQEFNKKMDVWIKH
jgi:hypothetical protein